MKSTKNNHALPYSIYEKYKIDIRDIYEVLDELQDGKIRELTGSESDSSLDMEAGKLKYGIALLLERIQNGLDGFEEEGENNQ